MPLHRRLPKRGFNNTEFRDTVAIVNVSDLERCFDDGAAVNEASLRERGLIRGRIDGIKILGDGDITRKLTVVANQISAGAKEKLEKAGGTFATPS